MDFLDISLAVLNFAIVVVLFGLCLKWAFKIWEHKEDDMEQLKIWIETVVNNLRNDKNANEKYLKGYCDALDDILEQIEKENK